MEAVFHLSLMVAKTGRHNDVPTMHDLHLGSANTRLKVQQIRDKSTSHDMGHYKSQAEGRKLSGCGSILYPLQLMNTYQKKKFILSLIWMWSTIPDHLARICYETVSEKPALCVCFEDMF